LFCNVNIIKCTLAKSNHNPGSQKKEGKQSMGKKKMAKLQDILYMRKLRFLLSQEYPVCFDTVPMGIRFSM
jgi:hypothetical protein